MSPLPLVPDYIARLLPQVAGKPISAVKREFGLRRVIKLASNENPDGPPMGAIAAIEKAARDVHRYPDAGQYDLKHALATRHRLTTDEILLGNGSSELIDLLVRTFVGPDSHVLTSEGTFIAYKMSTEALGRDYRTVPLTADLGHDLDALVEALTPETKLVFVANPNNPTGTLLDADALTRFVTAMDAKMGANPPLLVLDEAYYEFIDPALAPDTLTLLANRPRTVLLRTFSKAYGLAGIRCGYALTSNEVAGHVEKVRSPFNVGSLAQCAAVAALEDDLFLARTAANNQRNRAALASALSDRGFTVHPSHTNFLLVNLGREAKPVFDALLARGIITRPMGVYGMATSLRFTVGTAEQNRQLLTAIDAIFGFAPNRWASIESTALWQMAQVVRGKWKRWQPTRLGA